MRILFVFLLVGALAGCANSPPLSMGGPQCYLLVDGKKPVAEVCKNGGKLRYHEILPGDAAYEIPPYVQAIFQVHGHIVAPKEVRR